MVYFCSSSVMWFSFPLPSSADGVLVNFAVLPVNSPSWTTSAGLTTSDVLLFKSFWPLGCTCRAQDPISFSIALRKLFVKWIFVKCFAVSLLCHLFYFLTHSYRLMLVRWREQWPRQLQVCFQFLPVFQNPGTWVAFWNWTFWPHGIWNKGFFSFVCWVVYLSRTMVRSSFSNFSLLLNRRDKLSTKKHLRKNTQGKNIKEKHSRKKH